MKRRGEDSHLEGKDTGLEQILPHGLRRNQPADTLTRTPSLQDQETSVCGLRPGLQCFVTQPYLTSAPSLWAFSDRLPHSLPDRSQDLAD